MKGVTDWNTPGGGHSNAAWVPTGGPGDRIGSVDSPDLHIADAQMALRAGSE